MPEKTSLAKLLDNLASDIEGDLIGHFEQSEPLDPDVWAKRIADLRDAAETAQTALDALVEAPAPLSPSPSLEEIRQALQATFDNGNYDCNTGGPSQHVIYQHQVDSFIKEVVSRLRRPAPAPNKEGNGE